MLKWILKNCDRRMWNVLIWLRTGTGGRRQMTLHCGVISNCYFNRRQVTTRCSIMMFLYITSFTLNGRWRLFSEYHIILYNFTRSVRKLLWYFFLNGRGKPYYQWKRCVWSLYRLRNNEEFIKAGTQHADAFQGTYQSV